MRILFHRNCETEMRIAVGRSARLYDFFITLVSEILKLNTVVSHCMGRKESS